MKKLNLILLASILLASSSCVKDIYLDAGEKPKVVVECVLTEDPVQELYLSYTKGVSQKEADPLLEAEARLVDLDRNYSVSFDNAEKGKWTVVYSPHPGHKYRLEIIIPGHKLITAETQMPLCDVKQAYLNPSLFHLLGPGWVDFCEKINQYGYSGGSFYYNIPDHSWIYFINEDGSLAKSICSNYPEEDCFNLTGETYVPPDSLSMFCTSKELILSHNPNIIGSELEERPVYLYPTLKGKEMHDTYVRIPKGAKNTQSIEPHSNFIVSRKLYEDIASQLSETYQFSGSFTTHQKTGTLCFEALSEEYDHFLVAALKGIQLEKSTDISRIYLRENHFESNIQGGIGIFGAKNKKELPWYKSYSSIDYIVNLDPDLRP